jgi:hypothetical protein
MAETTLVDLLVRVARRPSVVWATLSEASTVADAWQAALDDPEQHIALQRCYPIPLVRGLVLRRFGAAFDLAPAFIEALVACVDALAPIDTTPPDSGELGDWAYDRRDILVFVAQGSRRHR